MNNLRFLGLALVAVLVLKTSPLAATPPWPQPKDANMVLGDYFRQAVAGIAEQTDTRNYQSAEQWLERKELLRDQLADMLGLVPEPPRSDLNTTIVDSIERDGIVVQKLHFQALPGLYVAANLYRPVKVEQPLPAILYVCGHSRQVETVDGKQVSYGNKTGYQRHGAWFAQHGYICLMIDTIQWGEFLGSHWGTYSEDRWDWLSTGYTPAGVEAWSAIRAIDYLETLPEVDAGRIGLTGRSGGGAYSWFAAALDDRVQVVVPVAGITDLENYVVDGCISGHCDCMFFVNYHQWDYPTLAALIAPRPLLLANSDNDSIFPLSGVLRTAQQVRHVYQLLDAEESFEVLITPGTHQDTPELQANAFRWFDRHLKGIETGSDEPALEPFDRKELKVFDDLPQDQRVTVADEVFAARLGKSSDAATATNRDQVLNQIRKRSLSAWPQATEPLEPTKIWSHELPGGQSELWEFTSQEPWQLRAILLRSPAFSGDNEPLRVHLADDVGWQQAKQRARGEAAEIPIDGMTLYVAVRGIGPHAWSGTDLEKTHIKRRFYLIGQTLEGMQIWDAVRGIVFAKTLVDTTMPQVDMTYDDSMRGIASYAAALTNDPSVTSKATLPADYPLSVPLLGQSQIRGFDALFEQDAQSK